MGSRVLFCVVLAASLSLCACEPSAPETVRFLDGKFEVLKPGSWSLRDDLNDQADLQMGNRFSDVYGVILSEDQTEYDSYVSLSDFSYLTREAFEEILKGIHQTGPENLTLQGQKAIRYDITGELEGMPVRYWHVVVESGDFYHQIVLWTRESRFERNAADFDLVLNSLRATDG